jgi:hypothetical protein
MELLQVGGPLLMAVVMQFPLCLYELQRIVINVYDCILPHNVMFPLMTGLYNGIHFLVIGGVFPDSIGECLTMLCHWMTVLSDNCAHNIVRFISLNLERLLQIGKGEYWSGEQEMLQIIEFLLVFLLPHELGPATALGHLDEGPCNMG